MIIDKEIHILRLDRRLEKKEINSESVEYIISEIQSLLNNLEEEKTHIRQLLSEAYQCQEKMRFFYDVCSFYQKQLDYIEKNINQGKYFMMKLYDVEKELFMLSENIVDFGMGVKENCKQVILEQQSVQTILEFVESMDDDLVTIEDAKIQAEKNSEEMSELEGDYLCIDAYENNKVKCSEIVDIKTSQHTTIPKKVDSNYS